MNKNEFFVLTLHDNNHLKRKTLCWKIEEQ
jgi:hypothetical protein